MGGPSILVAIPPTGPVRHLLGLASAMAGPTGGDLLLATVLTLPRITPYAAADTFLATRSRRLARMRSVVEERIPTNQVVVVAHGVASGLVEVARQRDVDLLVVGWPGDPKQSRLWSGSRTSVREVVMKAPCSVCIVERLPAKVPRRVLVSVSSPRETALAVSMARAVIRESEGAAPKPPARRLRGENGGRNRSSSLRPGSAGTGALDRITITGGASDAEARAVVERATTLGADVLIAGALGERGVWPLRRTVLRTELAESFPGPVALFHVRNLANEALWSWKGGDG